MSLPNTIIGRIPYPGYSTKDQSGYSSPLDEMVNNKTVKFGGNNLIRTLSKTWKSNTLTKVPSIYVYLFPHPVDISKMENIPFYEAIWDTGNHTTGISRNTARRLHLLPTGRKAEVKDASGNRYMVDTYNVAIYFDDNFYTTVEVRELLMDEFDVLIGMDIIQQGDFAITNSDGRTTISFRVPSQTVIDFEK